MRPYLRKNKNDLKKSGTRKIRLTIVVNFMSLKDSDKELPKHSKSDNLKIMINDKADKVIEELFQLHLSRYEIRFQTQCKLVISYLIMFIYYKPHKIIFKRG